MRNSFETMPDMNNDVLKAISTPLGAMFKIPGVFSAIAFARRNMFYLLLCRFCCGPAGVACTFVHFREYVHSPHY